MSDRRIHEAVAAFGQKPTTEQKHILMGLGVPDQPGALTYAGWRQDSLAWLREQGRTDEFVTVVLGPSPASAATEITDTEWRAFQAIPDQGYSHRGWLDRLITERVRAAKAEARQKARDEALSEVQSYVGIRMSLDGSRGQEIEAGAIYEHVRSLRAQEIDLRRHPTNEKD